MQILKIKLVGKIESEIITIRHGETLSRIICTLRVGEIESKAYLNNAYLGCGVYNLNYVLENKNAQALLKKETLAVLGMEIDDADLRKEFESFLVATKQSEKEKSRDKSRLDYNNSPIHTLLGMLKDNLKDDKFLTLVLSPTESEYMDNNYNSLHINIRSVYRLINIQVDIEIADGDKFRVHQIMPGISYKDKIIKTSKNMDTICSAVVTHIAIIKNKIDVSLINKKVETDSLKKYSKELGKPIEKSEYSSSRDYEGEYRTYDCLSVIQKANSSLDYGAKKGIEFFILRPSNESTYITVRKLHGKFSVEQFKKLLTLMDEDGVSFQ